MTFPKERLEDVVLYPCNISEENQMDAVLLSLTLKNYSKLEKNKIYYQCGDGSNSRWTMRIVISREILFVFLSTTTLLNKVYFRILKGKDLDNQIQHPTIQVIGRCLFVSEFCNKAILDPKNEYLHDDELIIQCVCNTKEYVDGVYTIYCEKPCEKDVNEICNNLVRLYKEGMYSDFIIEVKTTKFRVHKAVLAARSQFFGDLFTAGNTYNSIILKGKPDIMQEVLIYMYSGVLKVMDAVEMLEVENMANVLQMDNLKKRCLHFFETLDSDNVGNIKI